MRKPNLASLLRIITTIWLASVSVAQAQNQLRVLPADGGNPPRYQFKRWLLSEAHKHFEQRRATVAALATPSAVVARQTQLRAEFLKALGDFPEKTPLNPRVTGTLSRTGYRIEKVIYESRPQHHVTANLYLPEGAGPFPGVLVPCGHSANGKASEAYQKASILLALNGFVVLCYDPIGQGERVQLLNDLGQPVIKGSTSEHTMIGIGALLVGSSCATYRIWDGLRSLDYLASRPEVDPQRLGCTGNSGGGTLTAYLMALDDRIQVAAPSCYITSLERLFATIGPQDAEQNITGQVAFGMEHADYLLLRAPRPTLICTATRDYFDISGSWETYREAKQIYGLLGYAERVDLFEFNDEHGFSMPRRVAATRWMRRWLLNVNDAPVETSLTAETDLDLQCTRTGQVLTDAQGLSVFDLNRLASERFQAARRLAPLPRAALQQRVHELLHLPSQPPVPKLLPVTEPADIPRTGYTIRKTLIEIEPGLVLPAHVWQPAQPQPGLVVYLHDQGKLAHAQLGGEIERLVNSGRKVIAVDLRGEGELSPASTEASWTVPFGAETQEAFLSLHLNRPLLGQRVLDLQGTITALATPDDLAAGIEVIAIGQNGPVALHAALLDPRITRLKLQHSLAEWGFVAREPLSKQQLANVVPNVLASYDLGDVLAALTPRCAVTVTDPVNGRGESLLK